MDAFLNYLNMEGAGFYVWPPYFLAFSVMVGLWFVARFSMRRCERELERLQGRTSVAEEKTESVS